MPGLDEGADPPEEQPVAEQVPEVAVEEGVGEPLPGLEAAGGQLHPIEEIGPGGLLDEGEDEEPDEGAEGEVGEGNPAALGLAAHVGAVGDAHGEVRAW